MSFYYFPIIKMGTKIDELMKDVSSNSLSQNENSMVDSIINDINTGGNNQQQTSQQQTSQQQMPQLTDEERQMLMQQQQQEQRMYEQQMRQQQMQQEQMQQEQMQQEQMQQMQQMQQQIQGNNSVEEETNEVCKNKCSQKNNECIKKCDDSCLIM